MARKRAHRTDEIMLIPFLDILCSLIGVLVLIIVVLVVAQTQKINGRTPEELQRATDHLKLLKLQKENEKVSAIVEDKTELLEKLKEQAKEKAEQLAKLRKLLDTSAAAREKNLELSQNLLKELDNLLLEINGLNTQEPPLKKEIAALEAEIKQRKPPVVKGPAVVVQPGGSGLAKGTRVFFVEASAGKLTFYWDEKTKTAVSAVADVIAADVAFNAFLRGVLTVPQSKIIFLLREDGMGAFNLGAGWAQATYGYKVEQIGRLPIPGRGEIDLKMFSEFLGAMAPPPEAIAPPQATPTPGAPKTTPAPGKPAAIPALPPKA